MGYSPIKDVRFVCFDKSQIMFRLPGDVCNCGDLVVAMSVAELVCPAGVSGIQLSGIDAGRSDGVEASCGVHVID